MKALGVVLVIAAAGCADEPVPTCAQAVPHFYGVDCTFEGTVAPTNVAMDMAWAINVCQHIESKVPKRCRPEFDDWMRCLGDVDRNQCGSCTDEYDRLKVTYEGSTVGYVVSCD